MAECLELAKRDVLTMVLMDDLQQSIREPRVQYIRSGGVVPPGWNEVKSNVEYIRQKVDKMVVFDPEIEGTLVADGTEQSIVETSHNFAHIVEGKIDFSEMESNDNVKIRILEKLKPTGGYVEYFSKTYKGSDIVNMTNKIIRFKSNVEKYGIKITLYQTSGTLKDYDYLFFKMKKVN